MQAGNVARGYLYPNNMTSRCPMYSQCKVTGKCQSYDKHSLICTVCEQRVRPAAYLGGFLPEGEFEPDIQQAMVVIQNAMNAPMATPDSDGQRVAQVDMVQQKKIEQANAVMDRMMEAGKMTQTMEDEIINVSPEIAAQLEDLRY